MSSRGFTLVEVLIAVVLLAIGVSGISIVYTTTAKMNRNSYERMRALQELYNQIEEIRAHPGLISNDSIWVADLSTSLLINRTVMDSAKLDSMAYVYGWSEDDLSVLYKRPREIKLEALLYRPSIESSWTLEELAERLDMIDPELLVKIMDYTVIEERK
jgi:type IV pilus modification protein PilV